MKKEETRKLAITAMLTAITFLIGLTPIGYITLPMLSMTLLCIPVIIGTVTEGLGTGLWISLAFGITSLLKAIGFTMVPDALGTFLLNISVLKTLVCIFVPRLLIPVTTWLTWRTIRGEGRVQQRLGAGAAAFVGSATNTVLFLGAMYLLFLPEIDQIAAFAGQTQGTMVAFLAGIAAVNGLPEAAVAVLLCVPIIWALQKMRKRGENSKQSER
jgi:uncharacterized membrane protein